MARSIVSAAQTILTALGIDGIVVGVTFDTLGVSVTNFPRDITVGSTTYTGIGSKGLVGEGFGENLRGESPAPVLRVTLHDFTWHTRSLNDTLRGDTATVTLLLWDGSAWISSGHVTTYDVDADALKNRVVEIKLGTADAASGTEVPRRTTQEYGCQHEYKVGACVYRGTIATCDKGFDSPNGCKAHLPDITINGDTYPVPKPYGAFLGNVPHGLVIRG